MSSRYHSPSPFIRFKPHFSDLGGIPIGGRKSSPGVANGGRKMPSKVACDPRKIDHFEFKNARFSGLGGAGVAKIPYLPLFSTFHSPFLHSYSRFFSPSPYRRGHFATPATPAGLFLTRFEFKWPQNPGAANDFVTRFATPKRQFCDPRGRFCDPRFEPCDPRLGVDRCFSHTFQMIRLPQTRPTAYASVECTASRAFWSSQHQYRRPGEQRGRSVICLTTPWHCLASTY